MTRSVSLLLLAAAVATAAAVGAADTPVTVAAAEGPATADAATVVTDLTPAAPEALAAPDAPETSDLDPRTVVPTRDVVAAAPDPRPDPDPQAEPEAGPTAADEPPARQLRGTGPLLAAVGESADEIDAGGPTVRFSVEVEQGTGLDPDAVAAVVEEALYDSRSWAASHDLQRVAPADAWLHVVIATPGTVDTLCQRAGLNTAGWLSCWNGDTAAINLARWNDGVAHIDDLATYRRYVVNHEVGHGLGHGHVDCPGRGQTAPVMQQQTKTLDGCVANEWAYP